MIGKVIGGTSFGGTVGYVMKSDAKILDSEGITPPEVRDMAQDFADQSLLNPRVKNTVGHISLSFSEHDKDKLTDKMMTEIACEYMQKMGITDTQFLIVRHHDAPHPHCHIVYNRVKNDGSTIPDSNNDFKEPDNSGEANLFNFQPSNF
jgi:type IV secretory pathway VirD2 relaxase